MLVENVSVLVNVELYILLFFVYSFAGWFMESVGGILNVKKFINRGFLIGPYCPVYGVGVVLITLLLKDFTDDILSLVILSMFICGILEYLTSFIMEKWFGARWWDYSNNILNINGRICLETLLPFTIAGVVVILFLNPFFIKLFLMIPEFILHIITISLSVLIIIDGLFSLKIMYGFKNATNIRKDNTEEISKRNMDLAEDAIMVLESNIRHRTRKFKVKTLRKVRYRKFRVKEAINDLPNTINAFSSRIKEERKQTINKIDNIHKNIEIELKKAKETFKDKSILNKRLLDAFPKAQIIKESKKKKTQNKNIK